MKVTAEWKVNFKSKEVMEKMRKATREGLRDGFVKMYHDTQMMPPMGSPYKTGNNRRMMGMEVSGMGNLGAAERVCDPEKDEAAIYGTSGYSGWLEIGWGKMGARPYIKPAFDRHKAEILPRIKEHLSAYR